MFDVFKLQTQVQDGNWTESEEIGANAAAHLAKQQRACSNNCSRNNKAEAAVDRVQKV